MNIKPIRSDADYDAALEEIERLFASEPGSEGADHLEVLVVLAHEYQRVHYRIGPPDLEAAIEFEMDRRGLTGHTPDDAESAGQPPSVVDTLAVGLRGG